MEYVEGLRPRARSCRARRRRGRAIPPWVGAWIIAEAAKGLHYAHEKKDEGGAAARDRPPRREPAEHPPLVRGGGEDRRLRHRQREALRRGAGRPQGQVRVHVARAGARREGRPAERPLRARRHLLGDPRRAAAPRRARRRGAPRHRALGRRRAADARTSRTIPPELEAIVDARARADARGALPDGARARGGDRARAPRQAGARRRDDARADDRAARLARGDAPGRERAAAAVGGRLARAPTMRGRMAAVPRGAQLVGRLPERPSPPTATPRRARARAAADVAAAAPRPTGRARCATSRS